MKFYKPAARARQVSSKPLHLDIGSMSHDLRGIARNAGKTVFVDNALPGERVIAKIERSSGRYLDAKALSIETASGERQSPRCKHYGVCGGCSLQHLDDARQIHYKQQAVLDQLQRFADIQPHQLDSPLPSQAFGYRCRARLAVYFHRKQQQLLIGFREARGRQVVNLTECPVLAPELEQLIMPLQKLVNRLAARDTISHVDLALSDQGRSVLFRHLKPIGKEDMLQLRSFADEHLEQFYLQPGDNDSVHCAWSRSGESLLRYNMKQFDLHIDYLPVDFTQVNPRMNQAMVEQAMEWLQPGLGDTVLDLFCGLGNFSLPAASLGALVTGVEGSAAMTQRAAENIPERLLGQVRYVQADLSRQGGLANLGLVKIDKVLLDPPRAGANEIIDEICAMNPQSILYISCDSATFSRDTARLTDNGYVLQRFGVMDMFPQTSHVESMALFSIGS